MPSQFTLPPDTRAAGTGNPPADMNNVVDALAALGAGDSVLNAAYSGGADPTGAAASDAAFAAAIGAGGLVLVPPGTYLLNGSAALALSTAGTKIIGGGTATTTIKIGAGFTGPQAFAITADSCEIRDLSIVGANTGNSALGGSQAWNGIEITGAQHVKVRGVFAQYVNGWAIEAVGGASSANLDLMISQIIGRNCAGGIHCQGVTGSSFGGEHFLTDIQFQQTGTGTGGSANLDGIMLEDVSDVLTENYNASVSYVSTGSALHIKGTCSAIAVISPDLGCFPNTTPVASCILIEDSSNGSPTDCRFTGGVLQQNLVGMTIAGAATRIAFNGLTFKNHVGHGVTLSGTGSQINFSDCTWNGNGAGGAGTNYEMNVTGSATGRVFNCHFLTAITSSGTPGVQDAVSLNSSGQDIQFHATEFRGTGIAPSTAFAGNLPSIVRNCKNYNPHGAQTVTVPGSGSATTALHYDAIFYITAGSSTCTIVKNTAGQGGGTGPSVVIPASAFATVHVPAQATITPTYTNAPTWVVDGL